MNRNCRIQASLFISAPTEAEYQSSDDVGCSEKSIKSCHTGKDAAAMQERPFLVFASRVCFLN